MLKRLAVVWRTLSVKLYSPLSYTVLILATVLSAVMHTAVAQRRPARPAPLTAVDPGSRLKGIWEPVNYGQDISLESVYFVTPAVGWASGKNGTIIKTVDAGGSIATQMYAEWAGYLYPFNLTGHPAMSLPCGFSPAGLPIGPGKVIDAIEAVTLLCCVP